MENERLAHVKIICGCVCCYDDAISAISCREGGGSVLCSHPAAVSIYLPLTPPILDPECEPVKSSDKCWMESRRVDILNGTSNRQTCIPYRRTWWLIQDKVGSRIKSQSAGHSERLVRGCNKGISSPPSCLFLRMKSSPNSYESANESFLTLPLRRASSRVRLGSWTGSRVGIWAFVILYFVFNLLSKEWSSSLADCSHSTVASESYNPIPNWLQQENAFRNFLYSISIHLLLHSQGPFY